MEAEDMMRRLSEPFDAGEVKWKPQAVKGNRALAVCYIDARLVMDRLDEVFGVGGWQDEYTPLANGAVLCRLSVKMGGEWVAKQDVGSESEQPDEHDRTKAAFSDALKRVAVKFGVGRYLYRLGHNWHDYDPAKRQFVGRPTLPRWALPGPVTHTQQLPAYPEKTPEALPESPAKQQHPATAAQQLAKKAPPPMPVNGAELLSRVKEADATLVKNGKIKAGELVKHVTDCGVRAGYSFNVETWTGPAILFGVDTVKLFVEQLKGAGK